MNNTYEVCGETFYIQKAPNGYLVVMHDRSTSDGRNAVVGYVGVREDGTPDQPYGWVTPQEVRTERHTHRGLKCSNVSDPPTIEGQLNALCHHYLGEWKKEREPETRRQQLDHSSAQAGVDEFLGSLSDT